MTLSCTALHGVGTEVAVITFTRGTKKGFKPARSAGSTGDSPLCCRNRSNVGSRLGGFGNFACKRHHGDGGGGGKSNNRNKHEKFSRFAWRNIRKKTQEAQKLGSRSHHSNTAGTYSTTRPLAIAWAALEKQCCCLILLRLRLRLHTHLTRTAPGASVFSRNNGHSMCAACTSI